MSLSCYKFCVLNLFNKIRGQTSHGESPRPSPAPTPVPTPSVKTTVETSFQQLEYAIKGADELQKYIEELMPFGGAFQIIFTPGDGYRDAQFKSKPGYKGIVITYTTATPKTPQYKISDDNNMLEIWGVKVIRTIGQNGNTYEIESSCLSNIKDVLHNNLNKI